MPTARRGYARNWPSPQEGSSKRSCALRTAQFTSADATASGVKNWPSFFCREIIRVAMVLSSLCKFGWIRRPRNSNPAPSALTSRLVQIFSFTRDTVLDPFCGTASAMVAARPQARKKQHWRATRHGLLQTCSLALDERKPVAVRQRTTANRVEDACGGRSRDGAGTASTLQDPQGGATRTPTGKTLPKGED